MWFEGWMSPSRGKGGKRKRSLSPASAKSPETKKGKLDSLLSFLTPGKAKPDAEKKKKRLSFGAPVVHAFDAFSPPCRRRALYDNANMDASKMEKGLARLSPRAGDARPGCGWCSIVRVVRACVRACACLRACANRLRLRSRLRSAVSSRVSASGDWVQAGGGGCGRGY